MPSSSRGRFSRLGTLMELNSMSRYPWPMPKRNLPPHKLSRVAVYSATIKGSCMGSRNIAVPRYMPGATPAKYDSSGRDCSIAASGPAE